MPLRRRRLRVGEEVGEKNKTPGGEVEAGVRVGPGKKFLRGWGKKGEGLLGGVGALKPATLTQRENADVPTSPEKMGGARDQGVR